MYSRFVPSNPTFPYAVVDIPDVSHDWNFTDIFEEVDIQFSVFSTSQSESEITDAVNKLITLYDESTLSVSGYTCVYMHRERIISLSDIEQGIRQNTIIYNLLIEK